MKHYIRTIGSILLVIIISMGLALILPPYQKILDFVVLYAADLGILHRIPIYNTPAITHEMITHLKLSNDFTLHPYPYPPWFALSTFYLAFLLPSQAANAWMLLNIAMLLTSTVLLTDQWKPIQRILAIFAALIFIPSLGLIVVGQYSAPILLGATLILYAVKRENAPLTALGLLLLTFKPHLGLFLLPFSFFWLVRQNTPFTRRTLQLTISSGLILAALGFLADPAWPISYLRALLDYSNISGVTDLGLSAGFSAMLIKLIFGQGSAIWSSSLSLAFIAIIITLFWRYKIFNTIENLVAGCTLLTLLGDPYLLNYDYILILLPLAYLIAQVKTIPHRILLGIVYCTPWLSLLFQRNANILYAISAIILLIILLHQSKTAQKLAGDYPQVIS